MALQHTCAVMHTCRLAAGVARARAPVAMARRPQHLARIVSSMSAESRCSRVVTRATLAESALIETSKGPFPDAPGVYAIFDKEGKLQYMGLSRRVSASIDIHQKDLPELCVSAKVRVIPGATKEQLQEAWKEWITEHMEAEGEVPPGNKPGETKWTARKRVSKPDIKLTPGKGMKDLSVTVEQLIDMVVKQNRVVAFIKGTRTEPQCGFSHKMLSILNSLNAEYEVVNVLDEVYNPGLREAIKEYSAWPTIPQLYVDGEFVGGSDITEEMFNNGQLAQVLRKD